MNHCPSGPPPSTNSTARPRPLPTPQRHDAAERSLRHLVVSRKVSGGTRSRQGTYTKMTLTSIFGTWRAQGLNPLTACQQLLTSPQV